MRVFGLWWGGSSYNHGELATDCETWDSMLAAQRSFVHRYQLGYHERDLRARVVDFDEDGIATVGPMSGNLHPVVSEDCYLDLYGYERLPEGRFRIFDEPYARLTLTVVGKACRIGRETF